MPELPDIVAYQHALTKLLVGETLESVRLASPFVLRTVDPTPRDFFGAKLEVIERIGKRIVFAFDQERFAVIHLMVSGRFQWKEPKAKVPAKIGLLAFDFAQGALLLTEASTKKRASLHLVRGREALEPFRRGGVEPLEVSRDQFREALLRERHTLKRALTDPRLFSGIGNAYSDEILHAAKLSPVTRSDRLSEENITNLYTTTQRVLRDWTARLVAETEKGFPKKVTAFRPEMAVHGKYGTPCPVCGSDVQRIVYAENESNYCARCQTGGKLLADRSLSRLLKDNWPKTIDELEGR